MGLVNISFERLHIDLRNYSVLGSKLFDSAPGKNLTGPLENSALSYDAYNLIFHFKNLACTYEELKESIDSTIEKAEKTEQKLLKDFSYTWYYFKKGNMKRRWD